MTVHIAATQGTVAMCDEIEDPRVRTTLSYIIRQYDPDNNTVEIHFPTGGRDQVSYLNIQENLAEKLDGRITENSDLILNFYVNSDDQIIKDTEITIKEWETQYWVGELT